MIENETRQSSFYAGVKAHTAGFSREGRNQA